MCRLLVPLLLALACAGAATAQVASAPPSPAAPPAGPVAAPSIAPLAPSLEDLAVSTGPVQMIFLNGNERTLARQLAPVTPLVKVQESTLKALVTRYERAVATCEKAERDRLAREKAEKKAKEEEEKRARRKILPAIVRSVRLEGRVDQQTATVHAKVDVAVGENSGKAVKLLPLTGALSQIKLPHADDTLEIVSEASDRWLSYVPAKGGDRTVELDFVAPLSADRSRRTLGLALPGAANQVLALSIPGPVTGLGLLPAWLPSQSSEEGTGLRVETTLGGTSNVTLSWMAHASEPAPKASAKPSPTPSPTPSPKAEVAKGPRLFVNVSTLYSVGDRIVRFHSWVDVANSRDRIPALELLVPMEVQIRQIVGPLVKSHELSPRGQDKIIRVLFTESFRGKTAFQIDGEVGAQMASKGISKVGLPIPTVPSAVRVHGQVGICAFTTCRLQPDPAACREVSSIEVQDLPEEVTSGAPSPVLLAFRLASQRSRLGLSVTRFNAHERLTTSVEGVNAVTVLSPAQQKDERGATTQVLRSYNRLVMKLANAGKQELEISLPRGSHIESCFVDLIPRKPVKGPVSNDRSVYLIPLRLSTVAGDQLVPFPVEIAFRYDLPWRERIWQTVRLPFPSIDAPVTDANWKVYLPDGHSRLVVAGAFHELLTASDLLLVQYGQWLFELLNTGGRLLFIPCLVLGLVILVVRYRRSRRQPDTPAPPVASVSLQWLGTLLIPIFILGCLASIAVPNFKSARERANTRACYANQKTVAGALEMFNLDKNTKLTTISPSILGCLKSGGYLQSTPQDPGQGAGSAENYKYITSGNGICCSVHGAIQ